MAKKKDTSTGRNPLRPLCELWLSKIKEAGEVKWERFGQFADEAMKFFDGQTNWMWQDQYARGNGGFLDKQGGTIPNFRVQINKVFEAVALFGPSLYHQNPNVQCTPRMPLEIAPQALGIDPNDPMGAMIWQSLSQQEELEYAVRQTVSSVKGAYLNWLQLEGDKKTHARRAITEAVVGGLGLLVTEMYTPPHSQTKFPRSRYLSQEDYLQDPDADYKEDVQWISIRCVHPVNLVEREYGLEPGTLEGNLESFDRQAKMKQASKGDRNKQRAKGVSYDLLEYYKIYSKNGMGDRLKQAPELVNGSNKYDFSEFGDYCYIVVARGVPFPLNLPPEAIESESGEELLQRMSWPIPFWTDAASGGWPVSSLAFYDKPKDVWPISLIKPCIGELRFINWAMSFLADKVAASSTTYIAVLQSALAGIQKQLNGEFAAYTVIQINEALAGRKMDEIVSFLQAPQFSIDIWKMISEVMVIIDKRTGLTELMYGLQATQDRSATATKIKEGNTAVRPDDMASKVEDWLSEVATREMQAARWMCGPEELLPVVGRLGAMVWQQSIMTQDIDAVTRDYEFRIEAGSARKPNKQNKADQLTQFGQVMAPLFQEALMAGNPAPYNAYMTDVAKSLDIDPRPYAIQPPDPSQGPSPQDQELQAQAAELQMKQQEAKLKLAYDVADHDQELRQDEETHQQEIRQQEETHKLTLQEKQAEIALKKKAAAAAKAARPKPKAK